MALLHELYEEVCKRSAHAIAYIAVGSAGSQRLQRTYSELIARSKYLAAGLSVALEPLLVDGRDPQLPKPAARTGTPAVVAVQLARTHVDFLPLVLAASRCGVSLVFVSTDIEDKKLQEERDLAIRQHLQPCLYVFSEVTQRCPKPQGNSSVEEKTTVTVESLGDAASSCPEGGPAGLEILAREMRESQKNSPVCFFFTGGTTRGRCVIVTHSMFEHESKRYAECVRFKSPARVLAQTSVYWGASALGQFSIALAYGGCAVITEACDPEDLRAVIADEAVNVLGVVPDQLKLLSEVPGKDFPNMQGAFTWGEGLPAAVAERWRDHPGGCQLVELLISTEYWLSLYSLPLAEGGPDARRFRCVPDAKVLVVDERGQTLSISKEKDALGELLIAGPMVTYGYVRTGRDASAALDFVEVQDEYYFRTGDLVSIKLSESDEVILQYCGRLDMTFKEHGKWVDMRHLEERLRKIDGIDQVVLLPDAQGGPEPHACFPMRQDVDGAVVVKQARDALPRRCQLHVLDTLPKHPVTNKIDVKKLKQLVHPADMLVHGASWPTCPDVQAVPGAERRMRAILVSNGWWTMVVASFALAWDLPVFVGFLKLVINALRGRRQCEAGFRPCRLYGFGFWGMPFMHLMYMHATSVYPALHMFFSDRLPGSIWSCMFMACVARGGLRSMPWRRLRHAGHFLEKLVLLWFAGGFVAACRRRRLAWPIVFWANCGYRVMFDCDKLRSRRWWRSHLKWQLEEFVEWATGIMQAPGRRLKDSSNGARSGGSTTIGDHHSWRDKWPSGKCIFSGKDVYYEWPPPTDPSAETGLYSQGVGGFPNGYGHCVGWAHWPEETEVALTDAYRIIADGESACAAVAAATESLTNGSSGTPEPAKKPVLLDFLVRVPDVEEVEPWKVAGGVPRAMGWKEFDDLWWKYKTRDVLTMPEQHLASLREGLRSKRSERPLEPLDLPDDATTRRLCRVVGQAAKISDCSPQTPLNSLDSMLVAVVATRVRAEFNLPTFSVAAVRRADTVADLREEIEQGQPESVVPVAAPAAAASDRPDLRQGQEFAVYFSPGQAGPMGSWVMRRDDPVDEARLLKAAGVLIQRHQALRSVVQDPIRLISFTLELAQMYKLLARQLDARGAAFRVLRRLLFWSIKSTYGRIRVRSQVSVYEQCPEQVPLEFVEVKDQVNAEWQLGNRRTILAEVNKPMDIAVIVLQAELAGLWVRLTGKRSEAGDFVIAPSPCGKKLYYVDRNKKLLGELLGQCDPRWVASPSGFAPLFCATLSPPGSGYVWFRITRQGEMDVVFKPALGEDVKMTKWRANRMPGGPSMTKSVSFLAVTVMHSHADGYSFEPICGDLVSIYDALSRGDAPTADLPALGNSAELLQGRLHQALTTSSVTAFPQQCSLRGSYWRYRGKGYVHQLQLSQPLVDGFRLLGQLYGMPADSVVLGLMVCAYARAGLPLENPGDRSIRSMNFVRLTLYVPNRDGAGDVNEAGLFSDWRDIHVNTSVDAATVLGVVLDIAHMLRTRQWALFNPVMKQEATMVNFQPHDTLPASSRGGFKQLPETSWRLGNRLERVDRRTDSLFDVPQRLTFGIEQQDNDDWYINVNMEYEKHPPRWCRRFVRSFVDALQAIVEEPTRKVHVPFPPSVW
eukprot:TRINITY_DN30737_c0_g1_i1.p1 TRINITY_DN30737_c0_g1~~TRINITY_DN30737_c0_g1_i1.p1  ORF type:complete len:1678 (+),score=279.29 TRINITY_DN30737_c0_g1_i1:122-5035(+)